MSAAFIIPFNNQPYSISVKTGSYTIPAGYYARSVVECDSGGTFTIDTVTAVSTSGFINIDEYATSGTTVTSTVSTGYRGIVQLSSTQAADSVELNDNLVAHTANTNAGTFELGPAGKAEVIGGGTGNRSITGVQIPSNATHRNDVFWLPTGTVINGTGNWKAVVELYPMIS